MMGANLKLLPVGIDMDARQVELLDLRGAVYRERFMRETVARWREERPQTPSVRESFEEFRQASDHVPAVPHGFIFHVGRCGSTLLANMLSASSRHTLIKEPEPLSDLIAYWLNSGTAARREAESLILAMLRRLAYAADGPPLRVFKLAAWNVRMAGVLLRLFADVPAVFIYRSPLETVASMLFEPPGWFELIRCPREVQMRFFPTLREIPAGAALSPELLYAHAWKSAIESALAQPAGRMLLVDYGDLVSKPGETLQRVLDHFGEPFTPEQIIPMVDARKTYSKDPNGTAIFQPEGAHRRPPLSESQEAEVVGVTDSIWSRLRERRNAA